MSGMFFQAESFDGDISKWDVSRVTDMSATFYAAESFNGDISNWDVSSVRNMDHMFWGAKLFMHKLCGTAWVDSTASETDMFVGSPGSISRRVCTLVTRQRELIARTPIVTLVSTPAIISTITKTLACPKCGTFQKSGRNSCCAPGGAWFKNCGGALNKNVNHKWFDGVAACKRKFKANGI